MKKYSEEYLQRRQKLYKESWDFIYAADYAKAAAHAKKGLTLFPGDTIAAFSYYSILADYAWEKKTKKQLKLHAEAVAGMKKLLKKTSGQGISVHYKRVMKNEYYYQTQQFKKQYDLGTSNFKRSKDKNVLYSSGVGGANYALQLAQKGELKKARRWAKKGIEAWDIYFEYDKEYYNPYVHYALAWGVLGEKKKMMKALKDAAKRSGQPMSYKEFAMVIREIGNLNLE